MLLAVVLGQYLQTRSLVLPGVMSQEWDGIRWRVDVLSSQEGLFYAYIELPEHLRNKPLRLADGYDFQIGGWSLHRGHRIQPPDQDDGTNRWLRVEMNDNTLLDIEIRVCDPADINGDGIVDGTDLSFVLGAWGRQGPWTIEDVNRDHNVDGADLSLVLGAWNGH